MTSLQHIVSEEKKTPDQIKSKWLGAEARVGVPLRRLDGNRFRFRGRRPPTGPLLLSFVSGLTIGGCFVLFIRGRDRSRLRLAGHDHSGESSNVSTEVAHG